MAQDVVVMAFRKRLKKRGYTDISICWNEKKRQYLITAVDPLAGKPVRVYRPLGWMAGAMR